MNMLTDKDRAKLAKLLGLTSSNHDAEALAAARKAHRLLEDRQANWPQVLGLHSTPSEPAHVTLARDLMAKGKGKYTRWEMKFLQEVVTLKNLSDYQRLTLQGLQKKIC